MVQAVRVPIVMCHAETVCHAKTKLYVTQCVRLKQSVMLKQVCHAETSLSC